MAFTPTSPVTGGTSTVLTSPTFTLVQDTAPAQNAKQYYVSALGGTQTGVLAHSVAAPFTGTMFRPATLKSLSPVNPVTGVLRAVPMNDYTVITRKGVLPLAGQAYKVMPIRTVISVPAGADVADPLSLASAISFHIGLLAQLADELRKSAITGTI